jgi:hypothetical protein
MVGCRGADVSMRPQATSAQKRYEINLEQQRVEE